MYIFNYIFRQQVTFEDLLYILTFHISVVWCISNFKCYLVLYIISIMKIIPCGATFYESKARKIPPLVANSIWNTFTDSVSSLLNTDHIVHQHHDFQVFSDIVWHYVFGLFDFLLVVYTCSKYHCALTTEAINESPFTCWNSH